MQKIKINRGMLLVIYRIAEYSLEAPTSKHKESMGDSNNFQSSLNAADIIRDTYICTYIYICRN